MTAAPLDEPGRDALRGVINRCRDILATDFSGLLEGRFGIHPDGSIEPPERLELDDAGHATRDELRGILEHHATNDKPREARRRLLREATFTHLNRLVAIRVAEAQGLLVESIASGRRSRGFRDLVAEVAPLLGADDHGGYWVFLLACGDELAADAPVLFDPRNPLLALEPSPVALDRVVAELSAPSTEGLWSASDTLGWTYQFFNSDAERREMREGGAPKDWRELAVRNQFFTPGYVVRYLVHNTLGRRLAEANPESPLVPELDWLVDPPRLQGSPLDLGEVRVLDPACGSGHFLLGAYDVLERAWLHTGVEPADAAPRIVEALWGIDIDPRAVQVAAAVIVFRARRAAGPLRPLPPPNVVCARGLPPVSADLVARLAPAMRRILAHLGEQLERASVLGSLLKAEKFASAFGAHPVGSGALVATDEGRERAIRAAEEILAIVEEAADRATSTPFERLTAAEAHDAIRFVRALAQTYDAVVMNPPFGEPVEGTRDYLKRAYPWVPTKDANLFAAFVGRGLELCREQGYVGAITSRAGGFLTTFERWRNEVLLANRLVTLADLGFGVMKDAMVEAAAYVVGRAEGGQEVPATFFRLLREPAQTRGEVLGRLIERSRTEEPDGRIFRVRPSELKAVPGAPIAYWMTPSIRRLFTDFPSLEGHGAEVRQGLATGDDFRFVRAFWEVDPRRIGRTREETFQGKRWVPFAKGGEYSPFWADIHLVVDWERDGERIRAYDGSRPQNTQYFFRPGLTWPRRTASGFSPRVLPAGCAFADKGPGIITQIDPLEILGWLASRVGQAVLAVQLGAADETTSGAASKSYEVGLVGRVPWPGAPNAAVPRLSEQLASRVRMWDQQDETTRSFVHPFLPAPSQAMLATAEERIRIHEDGVLVLIDLSLGLDQVQLEALADEGAASFVDEEVGPHPATLPDTPLDGISSEWFALPMERLIAAATAQRTGLRVLTQKTYVADRRIEVLAHALERHPAAIVEARRAAGILPPEEPYRTADDLVSYLVGCAFGRWDIRMARDERPSATQLPDLFDPLPVCPPGMLVDVDGLPIRVAPPGYPLTLPSNGLLLDEPGHSADIVAAINPAAGALFEDPDVLLSDLEALLARTLRKYLREQFFKDHLGRYSKSRRKAPIYWPLRLPSKAWGVWMYAPVLSRETLFAVEAAADVRLHSAVVEIRRLEAEQLTGSGRSPRQLAPLLDRERRIAEELRIFQKEAYRIAHLGWEPDLDDGIVLCAAPLADLFPDWRVELVARRRELRQGKHPWAALHRYREAL